MITKKIKIANFNCTFMANNKIYPMLEYFNKILLQAITDTSLYRYDKKNNKKYYIANIELKVTEDNELLLIGKHYKRVVIDIRQDYNNCEGVIPKGNLIGSAPFSVFIIKLSNHRIIHFPDQKGSPTIASLNVTLRDIIKQYLNKVLLKYKHILEENNFVFENIKYKNLDEFKDKYFNNQYPQPVLDIVPMPSKELIKDKFELISKISSVKFKIFNLNSEIDYSSHFNSMRTFMKNTKGKAIVSDLISPQEKSEVERAIEDAPGKAYYKVTAKGRKKEEINFDSETIAEQIPVTVNDNLEYSDLALDVYNKVNDRKEMNEITEKNKSVYMRKFHDIVDFAEKRLHILRK